MEKVSQDEREIVEKYKKGEFHINGNLYLQAFWPPGNNFYYRFVVKGDNEKEIKPLYTDLFQADNDGFWDLDRFCKENNTALFLMYAVTNRTQFKDDQSRTTVLTFDACRLGSTSRELNQIRISYEPGKQHEYKSDIKIEGFEDYTPHGIVSSYDENNQSLFGIYMKPKDKSNKGIYVILDKDFKQVERKITLSHVSCEYADPTKKEKESVLVFSNDLPSRSKRSKVAYGGRVDGEGNITLKTKARFHVYQDVLQPIQCLPGFDTAKLEISNGCFEMKTYFSERHYIYKGCLNEDGQVIGDVSITITKQAPDSVYLDRSTLKLDEKALSEMAKEEQKHMGSIISLLHNTKGEKILATDYQQGNSSYLVGHYQADGYSSGRMLLQKNTGAICKIDGVISPTHYDFLPNSDLAAYQEDKTVVIIDGETLQPKARIISNNTGEVIFTIIGESGDYTLSGFKDEKTGDLTKVGGVVCASSSDQFIEINLSQCTTLNEMIAVAQKEITKFGGEPAYKGKRPNNSVKKDKDK